MRKIGIALIGMVVLASTSAFAEDKKEEAAATPAPAAAPGAPKYGPAGCGLGSMIFSPDSGFTQIFAATTNGTSANQTFGITSGTSNCDTGPKKAQSAKVYIQTNREALAKDIARGSGETLAGLSKVAGCANTAAVGASLQRNFKVIFPAASQSDDQVADKVMSALRSDKALACQI